MEEDKKCKKNARLPWKTKDILTKSIFFHGRNKKMQKECSSSMEDEGFFNNHLFSSMEDDKKTRNNSCLPWKTLKKETKNIHLALSK